MVDDGARPQWAANLKSRDAALRSPAIKGSPAMRGSSNGFVMKTKFDDPWFEPVASPPLLRAARRPVKAVPPAVQKNHCSSDDQEQRDSVSFERRAAVYRQHASDQWHHHRPVSAAKERWPDNVNARGKHMPDWCRSNSLFDPIQSTFKEMPAAANAVRPCSAPPMRPGWDNSIKSKPREQPSPQRSRGQVAAGQGSYNCISHTWVYEPDAALNKVRTAASDRVHGFLGIAARDSVLLRNSFSPITGTFKDGSSMEQHAAQQQGQQEQQPSQWQDMKRSQVSDQQQQLPPQQQQAQQEVPQQQLLEHQRQQQNQQQRDEHVQQRVQHQERPGSAAGMARSSNNALSGRPQSAGPHAYALPKRPQSAPRPVRSGASWGTYNVITHEWTVPPSNSRCTDPGRTTERSEWTSGTHVRRSDVPRRQGTYNPIVGEWVVKPESRRTYEGLDYAPVGWFGKPEVVRPRSAAPAGQPAGQAAPWLR